MRRCSISSTRGHRRAAPPQRTLSGSSRIRTLHPLSAGPRLFAVKVALAGPGSARRLVELGQEITPPGRAGPEAGFASMFPLELLRPREVVLPITSVKVQVHANVGCVFFCLCDGANPSLLVRADLSRHRATRFVEFCLDRRTGGAFARDLHGSRKGDHQPALPELPSGGRSAHASQ